MATRKRAEASLRAAQEQLEQRVQQRTADLARAIEALQAEVEERREIEAKTQEQRVHLLEAQQLANLGSWTWDIQRGTVSWSEQIFEIYGAEPADFGGTTRITSNACIPKIVSAFEPRSWMRCNPERVRIEERIVRPNGEVRHLQSTGKVIKNERGEPVRMLGICQDVTERKIAELALRDNEEQYRLLIDSVRDYAICMLDPDGRVISWNAGAARIKQYAADEILGQHFSRFYTEEDRAGGLPERALEIAAGGKYEADGWRVRKDGSRFWATVVIGPIRDEDGALVGYAKVTRDITEQRQTQTALDETREKLAQAQKMEALGQLTGGIAHGLQQPAD